MYNDYYGFTGRPFQLTPDPAFYFESASHHQAMSYLSYGLAQGEGFVVITGEVGAGKSTLAQHLMATIDRARLTAAQVVGSKLDADQMLDTVAHAFGVGAERAPKVTAIGAIERFLHEEARAGRRCLLLVDEAQNLPIEALEQLRLLSSLQLGAHPLLQIVLLGQPEFRDRLQDHPGLEQLRQRVIASHHLAALDPAEVERYVLHRLKCAGWNGHPGIDHAVYGELYAATGGVPRRINQVVSRLLLQGAVEQQDRIDGAMLAAVLADLAGDGGFQLAKPAAAFADHHVDAGAPDHFAAALTQRDVQIAELQQAVLELAEASDAPGEGGHHPIDIAALQERLANLESRVIEQERTIRHTLTMLIEWIERDDTRQAA